MVGVKTGYNDGYLNSDIESELSKPYVFGRDVKKYEPVIAKNNIIFPYDDKYCLVELEKYPKANSYLQQIKENLSNRAIIKEGLTREIITNSKINFLFPEFELEEIYNHKKEIIKKEFPMITRFSIYASALNIIRKDQTQLHLMKQAGLSLCYIGLESGSDEVLQLIKKGNTKEEIILACNRLSDGKIKISLIALLGIGGVGHSLLHAKETAEAVTKIAPEFLSFLTVTVVPHTALDVLIRKNKFSVLSHKELLMEMQAIIEAIELKDKRIIFRANHVSNNFPLAGVLAKDKEKMLGVIRRWIEECPDNTYPDLDYRCL